jgi:hypothetical protein
VRPLPAPDGQILLDGAVSPLGTRIGGRARVLAQDGRVVVQPEGLPFASLVTVPVFSSDRIAIDGLGATPAAGALVIDIRAHLVDR